MHPIAVWLCAGVFNFTEYGGIGRQVCAVASCRVGISTITMQRARNSWWWIGWANVYTACTVHGSLKMLVRWRHQWVCSCQRCHRHRLKLLRITSLEYLETNELTFPCIRENWEADKGNHSLKVEHCEEYGVRRLFIMTLERKCFCCEAYGLIDDTHFGFLDRMLLL